MVSFPCPEGCLGIRGNHKVSPAAKQAAHQDVPNKRMNGWAAPPSSVNPLWFLRAAGTKSSEGRLLEGEGLLGRDASPSQERIQAYGEEAVGTEQDTISSLALGGELGAGMSHTEKPDQDSSLQG